MYHVLPQLLSANDLAKIKDLLESGDWEEGRGSAGAQAARVKHNLQLKKATTQHNEIMNIVLPAIQESHLFLAITLAHKIYPPTINRYCSEYPCYDKHYDNSIRLRPDGQRIRADLSCTIFLSDPTDYSGGELIIHDQSAQHTIQLAAGSAVIYPADCLHQVLPVKQGVRFAAFFWLQSMVKRHEQRNLLYQLDQNIQAIRQQYGETDQTVNLTGVYHQLLRQWVEV